MTSEPAAAGASPEPAGNTDSAEPVEVAPAAAAPAMTPGAAPAPAGNTDSAEADGAVSVRQRAPAGGRTMAAVSLALGAAGIASAAASRRWPALLAVTAAAWAAALWAFATLARGPGRAGQATDADRAVPAGRRLPRPEPRWLAVPAALAVSVAARDAWPLVPVALAAWVLAARLLRVPWGRVLAAAVLALGAAAAAAAGGAAAAEDLALLAYALASVACGIALVGPGDGFR